MAVMISKIGKNANEFTLRENSSLLGRPLISDRPKKEPTNHLVGCDLGGK